MNVALLGATGLLGSALRFQFSEWADWEVTTFSRKISGQEEGTIQVGSLEELIDEIRTGEFQLVINCIALASHEGCEEDEAQAFAINAVFPGELASACSQVGARLIHISTDAVFDGPHSAPFVESDIPLPISVYGRSKLEGEKLVLSRNHRALVVRTNFFTWSRSGSSGVLDFFVNGLSEGKRLPGFTDYLTSSIYAGDLAKDIRDLTELDYSGVIHVVSSEAISKFSFGQLVAEVFELPVSLVVESSLSSQEGLAHRAPDLALSPGRLEGLLDRSAPSTRDGLQRAKLERAAFEAFWQDR